MCSLTQVVRRSSLLLVTPLTASPAVLRSKYSGNAIIIAGHTDSDPIRKSGHKSNYHLGFERGWSVRKFLTDKGISSDEIAVMSYGPDRPMGDAQKSRRVEIVVAQ